MTALAEAPPVREEKRQVRPTLPKLQRTPPTRTPGPLTMVYSYVLTMISVVFFVLLGNLVLVSQLQHFSAQHDLYHQFRQTLAEGSVPIGQTDINGHLVKHGTPIALLEIPELGIREVVVEGTASRQTKLGVGHRPDTPLPGQPGVSVLMGRSHAYGGVFGSLDKLKAGDTFTVVTGQGKAEYKVLGIRAGNSVKLPALTSDGSRLTLVTSTGTAFLPHGVLRVDADLITKSFGRPPVAFAPGVVDGAEQALKGDPSRLFALSWLLQLLVLITAGAVWAWKRWSHPAMWIVFAPLLAASGLVVADHICDLLPNLL